MFGLVLHFCKKKGMMTPKENLHYAIGQMAYAIAKADGEVNKKEREKFHNIVAAELRCGACNFNVSDIIFQVMDKDNSSANDAYDWGMKQIRLNSHYLSPALKHTFVRVMEKVAKAYPPVTISEMNVLERFKRDIEPLQGDPVFYGEEK
jgi:uncharacterized tellurite resistance protein B-like protein